MKSLSTRRRVEHPYLTPDPDRPWRQAGGRGHAKTHRSPMFHRQAVEDRLLSEELQGILDSVLTDLERDVVHCIVFERLSLQATAARLGFRSKSYVFRVRNKAFAKLREAIQDNPLLMKEIA